MKRQTIYAVGKWNSTAKSSNLSLFFKSMFCFRIPMVKNRNIGLQCVIGVLCLILFLSVGMLFSNISSWQLNCYKWKGGQVITIFKWKCMTKYVNLLYLYLLLTSNNWRLFCKKGVYGQFHVTDITFRGQMFGNKTFSYKFFLKDPSQPPPFSMPSNLLI